MLRLKTNAGNTYLIVSGLIQIKELILLEKIVI